MYPIIIDETTSCIASLAERVNRVQRWLHCLRAYAFVLLYRPGKTNGNADALSRFALPAGGDDVFNPSRRLTDPHELML